MRNEYIQDYVERENITEESSRHYQTGINMQKGGALNVYYGKHNIGLSDSLRRDGRNS
jgi:hypothetical protein